MLCRIFFLCMVGIVCLLSATVVRQPGVPDALAAVELIRASITIPTPEQFAKILETDPVQALQISIARYERDVVRFQAAFQKQERIGGRLQPLEVIRVAFRDEPFAVFMKWEQGGGSAVATLYARGEHGGKMLVQLPLLGVRSVDPRGLLPRSSARYSIEEFGLVQATKRTLRAWSAARERGELHVEFLGRRTVAQLDGRTCIVVRRHCRTDEIDAYATGDSDAVTDKNRPDAFRTVTLYLDCELGLQLGTQLHRADGELAGEYWFRELVINPTLPGRQFRADLLK